jgi:hypothetical protein
MRILHLIPVRISFPPPRENIIYLRQIPTILSSYFSQEKSGRKKFTRLA